MATPSGARLTWRQLHPEGVCSLVDRDMCGIHSVRPNPLGAMPRFRVFVMVIVPVDLIHDPHRERACCCACHRVHEYAASVVSRIHPCLLFGFGGRTGHRWRCSNTLTG
jgi:hypothetical protein